MKTVLIILKNLALGLVGAVVLVVIIDSIDLSIADYMGVISWGTYVGCKAGLELIKLESIK